MSDAPRSDYTAGRYPAAQLDLAFRIAAIINRGRFVLLEAPKP